MHLPFPVGDANYNHVAYDSTQNVRFRLNDGIVIDRTIYKYEGGSCHFTGDQYINSFAHVGSFDFGTGDFTIGFWLYADTDWATQYSGGVIAQHDNTNGFSIGKDNTHPSKLSFRIGAALTYSNADVSTATWEHWAFSRSSGTLRIFKNGSLDSTVAFAGNVATTTAVLWLGKSPHTGYNIVGRLDDVFVSNQAVWTSAFTPDEVSWDGIIHMPPTVAIKRARRMSRYSGIEIPVVTKRAARPVRFVNADRLTFSSKVNPTGLRVRFEPANYGARDSSYPLLFTNTNGNLRGVVLQNTVPIALCDVGLYDRYTKQLINAAKTKSDGTFRFNNLTVGYGNYFLVAFDPQGAPLQNAVILDKLVAT